MFYALVPISPGNLSIILVLPLGQQNVDRAVNVKCARFNKCKKP